MTPKWLQKNEGIWGEMPIGLPLVIQTVFVMKKLAPNAPKARPRTKNEPKLPKNKRKITKNGSKKSPENATNAQKWILFATKNYA